MTMRRDPVQTEFGETYLSVLICDNDCGAKILYTEDAPISWFSINSPVGRRDFHSIRCMTEYFTEPATPES